MSRRLALLVVSALVLLPRAATAQEVVEYYGTDALGSVRIVFDVNGNVVGRMDYGPFGEQVTVSTVGHKSYAGLFRDGEAGLDYAEARSYQVRTGRFSAPDPVYAGLFDPQAWNRYSYALNSPLSLADPTGLQAEGPTRSCNADSSFQQCGGDALFWNTEPSGFGFDFGGGFASAQDRGYTPGMPAEIWEGLQDFLVRAESAFAQWREERRERLTTVSTEMGFALDPKSPDVQMAASPQAAAAAAIITAANVALSNVPRAAQSVSVWGTKVHTAFATGVRAINLSGVRVRSEVSYLNGEITRYGKPGSVRLDAVIMRGKEILSIFDLKTGNAGMSLRRQKQIYDQLPLGQRPPITIIKRP